MQTQRLPMFNVFRLDYRMQGHDCCRFNQLRVNLVNSAFHGPSQFLVGLAPSPCPPPGLPHICLVVYNIC